jgi:outer membrane receptor protein involved in Fe transport
VEPGRISRAITVSALVLAFNLAAWGQSVNQGSIEGIVTDPSGAIVPGAILRATDQKRGATFITTSNADGLFFSPALPVGTYELSAEHADFAAWVERNIEVTVGAQINLNITLHLAGASESVVVSDSPSAVETTRSQVSFTVGARSISNLPANGRNFQDFALLTPGVTRGSRGAFDLSFGGQRKMNLVRVDGADNDNTFFTEPLGLSLGTVPYQFSLASVQEFQVNTNSFSAESGRAGAGLINVVTLSGTNDLHGSAFWYYRDKSLNANDLVNKLSGLPKSPFHFNQFGGTLGGPFIRNKLFFFFTYDGQRSILTNLVRLNLPANFSFSSDPTISSFQQQALDYLRPRASSWLRTFDQDVVFARADWRINSAHLLTGRWNRQRFTGGNLENSGPQNSFEHTGASLSSTDTLALTLFSSLSRSANSFLFAYVRSDEPGFSNSPNAEANIFQAGQLVLTIGHSPGPRRTIIDRLQWSDALSLLRGRHALKLGGDVLPNWISFFNSLNFSGSFRFSSLESFGRSLAGAPPAIPDQRQYVQAFSGSGAHGVTVHPDFTDYGGFAEDEWRVSQRLTLNLGLRYDLQVIRKPTVHNPAPALAAAGIDTSHLRTDKNSFAPRLGLAWSPLVSNRLVFRAGYGLFIARTPSIITSRPLFQNGITVLTGNFTGGTSNARLIPPYPDSLCGPPDPSGLPPNCAAPPAAAGNQLLQPFSPSYTQPYTQQGSLGVEFQMSKDLSVSASYLLVKGTHLLRWRDVNLATSETQATIGVANTATVLTYNRFALPRPILGFDRILSIESAASSIYHALALHVNKRVSHHFEFQASYTLSKTIDDNPEPIAVNPPTNDNLLLSDASNPRADRGSGVNDQRHRFVLSGIWQLREARSYTRMPRMLLGGWELSGIFTAQTGLPYSGLVSFDLNNDGNSANDRTPGLGRNTFHLPRSISLDPRVTKNLPISENVRLQFIGEAFNVFNHGNVVTVRNTQFSRSASPTICGIAGAPCLVPQNVGLSAFGTPTATSGPRIVQLSVKLIF